MKGQENEHRTSNIQRPTSKFRRGDKVKATKWKDEVEGRLEACAPRRERNYEQDFGDRRRTGNAAKYRGSAPLS
jgi:hypothetical protein